MKGPRWTEEYSRECFFGTTYTVVTFTCTNIEPRYSMVLFCKRLTASFEYLSNQMAKRLFQRNGQ